MKKLTVLLLPALLLFGCTGHQTRKSPTPPAEQSVTESVEPRPDPAARQPSRERAPAPVREPVEPPPAPTPPVRGTQLAGPYRPAPEAAAEGAKYVSLNFDNADIGVVIQTISELIGLNYIIAPGVKGRVTIQSSSKIPVSSLFDLLGEILEVNALTAVKSGSFYKIVPTNQARQKVIETIVDGEVSGAQQVITQVVPLSYIRPSEVVKILNPLKSPAGIYIAHDPTRLLLMTDGAKKITELMKIVSLLDVDTFERIQVELYPVRYADAEALAVDLRQVVSTVYAAGGRGKALLAIVPVPQINALMIISGEPSLAANIRSWVVKLDQPATESGEQIFVYPLAHAKAEEISAVLNQVFARETGALVRTTASAPAAGRTPAARTAQARRITQSRTAVSRSGGTKSPVTIVADKATNSLVIQTSPWYYPVVEETIRKLDVMPKQVLIEVLIAELTLDDETQFGLQWVTRGQGSATVGGERHDFNSQIQNVFPSGDGTALAIPTGFSWVLTEANRISAILRAYAQNAKLNVLSSPHIMAMDNMEATINIGDEVPIITAQTTETAGGTSTLSNTITNSVEYRDTGVILTVTPHINEGRYVTLDIRQEVSQAQTNTLGGTDSPIIRKRTVETTMVVKDNQTLVIGGLIDEQKDFSREGIPYLSRIPILGYLFGVTKEKISKTELVLLLTPRVVANPTEGNDLSRMLRDRVLTLKEGIMLFTDMPQKGGE
jgi:general secretion pathway protein D